MLQGKAKRSSSESSPSLASQVIPGVSSRYDYPLVASKTALLVVDIQDYLSTPTNDTTTTTTTTTTNPEEYLFKTALPQAIPNIVQLVSTIRSLRDDINAQDSLTHPEVVFTYVQSQTKDSRDVSLDYKLSGPKLSTDLPNPSNPATFHSLPTELQPSPRNGRGDILIPKTSCSVFQSTNITYTLRNLNMEQLIVCGQLTNQCIESAVRDAADLGFFVTVAADACAAKSLQEHDQGLQGMKGFARILTTRDIIQELTTKNPNTHFHKNQPETNYLTLIPPVDVDGRTLTEVSTRIPESPSTTSTLDAISALLYTLDYAGIEFLRFAVVDLSNILRTKAIPLTRLIHIKSATNNNSNSHFNLNNKVTMAQVSVGGFPQYGDAILPETQLDAKKVLALHPDVSTLRILPYASKSAMVLCTLWENQNYNSGITPSISPFCTRSILSKVIQQAQREYNIGFSIGVEIEFCLVHRPTEHPTVVNGYQYPFQQSSPIDYSLFCQTTILNIQEEFISEVCHALSKQRISVDLLHAESAYGQVELVLPYEKDPLLLADHIVFARETIMNLARKKNMSVLFLPKVYNDQAGNGMHLHLSLWDTRTGENIFPTSYPVGGITTIGQSFMEGILLHMPALLALTNPTKNSFLRIGKGCWTGSTCGWDIEDKEVPLRVCLDVQSGLATNVEYKLSDSTANVYLQIAGLLCSGLDGIRQSLQLRPAYSTSSQSSSVDLPSTLLDSLDLLQQDECLSQLLGKDMLTSYLAVKKADFKRSRDLPQDILHELMRSF